MQVMIVFVYLECLLQHIPQLLGTPCLGIAGHSWLIDRLLSLNRTSNSSTAVPGFGSRWPKSCECWRQITK